MSSEARIYSFSDETKQKLKKFRLNSSRADGPRAVVYLIDEKTHEIRQQSDDVYDTIEALADDYDEVLPDNSPRFVLLSYPFDTSEGRRFPYALLYYLPKTCRPESRFLYAGAKQRMHAESGAGAIIDIDSTDDVNADEIQSRLKAALGYR